MTGAGESCGLRDRLTKAARVVWAKHDRDSEGWLPLWRHMEDSAAVAGLLWDRWLPSNVQSLIAAALPQGLADARALVIWLAAVHDIGKATPAFACQVESLADRMRDEGLQMKTQRQLGVDRKMAPHGLAGQVLLAEWLEEQQGWTGRQAAQFGVVVGGHHGVPPDHSQLKDLFDRPDLLRSPGGAAGAWRRVQDSLLDACAEAFGVRGRLRDWQTVKLPQPVQVQLSALVIVADWIASNPELFPYFPQAAAVSGADRVAAAWRGLQLPPPWVAGELGSDVAGLFASRFALPRGARVRPVQEAVVRLAGSMPRPGLLVVEAPMGEGKTEAALAAAEILAARSGAGGVFFALPTMATGNAMFSRVVRWLENLPAGEGARFSVQLAHSKAALNEVFAGLAREGRNAVRAVDADGDGEGSRVGVGRDGASAELVAHQWLRGRKKAMLSSFVAGTVDQLLFMGLKSRHLALRHLAVAGKVVVIDEAHAYDAFMNVYLDRVLSWLGAYGVPVVVLSATLPARRRRELAEAYAGAGADASSFGALADQDAYPLVTAVAPGHAPVVVTPDASGREGRVELERFDDDLELLAGRLERELEGGGCVLVVRNTVRRVLETAQLMRARLGDAHVTVAHSAFVDLDRAANDGALVDKFGPPGMEGGRRPKKHVVVASQVAEQSLDVDFDLLVSDLCPVDLLLQRMGRLHRHRRGVKEADRPEGLRVARCLVTGADWSGPVPVPVRGSVAVYGAYALLRSAAVLATHLEGERRPVRLPQDISVLVQSAYGPEPAWPEAWAAVVDDARRRHEERRADQVERAGHFRLGEVGRAGRPLLGWVAARVGDADDSRAGRAQVRDSRESLEVLVVQRREDGTLATLPWLDKGRGGLELAMDCVPSPRAAKAAAASGLRLPMQFSDPEVMDRAIAELEQLYVEAWQRKESPWLAGQLILALDGDCQCLLAGYALRYSRRDGLEVTRA
ncbi:CRISPR-associated helicase Cas3' [Streptomyces platensis]|uniref:CRISPR-associated helicase Cas3' n=1 Tax=Streptomyces platensis TaxID=58346 RepID=UPI0037A8C0E9